MNFEDLQGIYPAIVTPMDEFGDEMTRDNIGPLMHFFEKHGSNGVLIGGSTGEFPSLTFDERIQLFDEASSTRGNLKLIACCGSSSLNETIALVDHAAKRNADAVLIPPPFYFRSAPAEGIEKFFDAVLERSPLPVLLYHIPSFTGIPITRELLEKLAARHEILWGIKDTGRKLSDTSNYLASKPGRVLLGSDTSILSGLKLGVPGIISALSNVCPEWTRDLYRGFRKSLDVAPIQNRIVDLKESIQPLPFHATLKFLLRLRGIECGSVRAPLIGLTKQQEEYLKKLFLTLGF